MRLALWKDMVKVVGDELFYAHLADNQAIVIPETIDAIRALTGIEHSAQRSIEGTNRNLGINGSLLFVDLILKDLWACQVRKR